MTPAALATFGTLDDLGRLLRHLRRRRARAAGEPELTYRQLADRTGWSLAAVGEYFTGKTLPPTDRFDVLVRLLGATPIEQGALATVRDRVEERRRNGSPGTAIIPRQLPLDVYGFCGRADTVAWLDARLDESRRGRGVVVAALSGPAGVGKTALAVHWAHRVAGSFPDGQLFINLRGFEPSGTPVAAGDAIRTALDAFAVAPDRIPPGLPAQVGLYRSILAGKSVLVVLDNARDSDQVVPLLPGSTGCLVLVTSRSPLPALVAAAGARPLPVQPMPPAEARELLLDRIGLRRPPSAPASIDTILARCAGLPLALTIVATRAAIAPTDVLDRLARELAETTEGLDPFAGGAATVDLRTVFSWSYDILSTAAARMFQLLGLHPGPDFGVPGLTSLFGAPTEGTLDELVRASLVTETGVGRYSLHDLLRAYVGELAATLAPAARDAALARMLEHYSYTAVRADRLLHPHRDPIRPTTPQPDASGLHFDDRDDALRWFTAEHQVLLAAVDLAREAGRQADRYRLAWALATFLDYRGHWHQWRDTQQAAWEAAQSIGDRRGVAEAHRGIANASVRLGRHADARKHYELALAAYRALRDEVRQADVHVAQAAGFERENRIAEALRHADTALQLYRVAHRRDLQAIALNNVGFYRAQLGDHERALADCAAALALHEEFGDQRGQAHAWDSIGYVRQQLGAPAEAVRCLRRAADLFAAAGDLFHEAESLCRLGDSHWAGGEVQPARRAWRRASGIFRSLDHPDAERVESRLAGVDTTPDG